MKMMEATAQDKKCAHKERRKIERETKDISGEKNILSRTANILQRKQFHWHFSKPIWRTLT